MTHSKLNSKIPDGPLSEKWSRFKLKSKLVNPSNKRKHKVIVVGTGLAGASASASLSELGYQVQCFCIQDSARRAHSIAAQGGINAAKNYPNDGDSVDRLFYDTVKGGDFRSREANVYRLAEISNLIIDHCVAQGIPFAREYGGLLDNRSFGGAQVSRTFYARSQTGQQLLLGAYSAMMRQVGLGQIDYCPRHEMLEIVVVDNKARGIVTRCLVSGKIEAHVADAVIFATGGYANVFYLSTNAMSSNVTASWRAYKKGAFFANPCFTQIHPTCIPIHGEYQSKLTLMSESLRNDGRVWVPLNKGDRRDPREIPEVERDYYLERIYPSFGNLAPRDVSSRQAKFRVDEGRGVGQTQQAVYLDFREAIDRLGKTVIFEKYGNLFQTYQKVTDEDPYNIPMRIYPAAHYTMGGLWVDYNLMSTIEGLFVLGEANFSDHGANRLGASALMQGLADGYFIIPSTLSHYLADNRFDPMSEHQSEFKEVVKEAHQRTNKFLKVNGTVTVDEFHRRLGLIMWEKCGMSRNKKELLIAADEVKSLRSEFWQKVKVSGESENINEELEKAGRVADFLELAELMVYDALEREESCGGHFRDEHQTEDNEARRDDKNFCHVAAWEHKGESIKPARHQEELEFREVLLATRTYK